MWEKPSSKDGLASCQPVCSYIEQVKVFFTFHDRATHDASVLPLAQVSQKPVVMPLAREEHACIVYPSLLSLGQCSFMTTASSAGCVPRAMVPRLSVTIGVAEKAGDLSSAAKPPAPRSALGGLTLSRACTLADPNRAFACCCCS